MPNYRGGGNDPSWQGSQAAKNIHNGDTPYQRKEALQRRAIFGGVQAGLAGISGIMHGEEAKRIEREQATDAAIKNATRYSMGTQGRDAKGPGLTGQSPRYGQDSGGHYPADSGMNDALSNAAVVSGQRSPDSPNQYIVDMGKQGIAQDDSNAAAAGAPVTWGGKAQYTPEGLSDHAANAGIQEGDIDTANRLMGNTGPTDHIPSFSGMQGSVRMRQ